MEGEVKPLNKEPVVSWREMSPREKKKKKKLHLRWILLQQGEKPQRVPEKWGVVVQYHSLSENTALN